MMTDAEKDELERAADFSHGNYGWEEAYPIIDRIIGARMAQAWDAGFSFGHWLERGYAAPEAHAKGVPDHLLDRLGLEAQWVAEGEEPEVIWNPYRV